MHLVSCPSTLGLHTNSYNHIVQSWLLLILERTHKSFEQKNIGWNTWRKYWLFHDFNLLNTEIVLYNWNFITLKGSFLLTTGIICRLFITMPRKLCYVAKWLFAFSGKNSVKLRYTQILVLSFYKYLVTHMTNKTP